jgi:hypothetical protein
VLLKSWESVAPKRWPCPGADFGRSLGSNLGPGPVAVLGCDVSIGGAGETLPLEGRRHSRGEPLRFAKFDGFGGGGTLRNKPPGAELGRDNLGGETLWVSASGAAAGCGLGLRHELGLGEPLGVARGEGTGLDLPHIGLAMPGGAGVLERDELAVVETSEKPQESSGNVFLGSGGGTGVLPREPSVAANKDEIDETIRDALRGLPRGSLRSGEGSV